MRLIKSQSTNDRFFGGAKSERTSVSVEPVSDKIELISKNSVVLPTGETTDRSNVPVEGMLRYNTTTNELEAYQNSAWRSLRFKEPTSIVKQPLGNGDADETVFGPLNDGSGVANTIPLSADAMIVLVENVVQISTTNYTLEQNVGGNLTGPNFPYTPDGYYIKFTSAVPLGRPVTVLHNFDK